MKIDKIIKSSLLNAEHGDVLAGYVKDTLEPIHYLIIRSLDTDNKYRLVCLESNNLITSVSAYTPKNLVENAISRWENQLVFTDIVKSDELMLVRK